MTAVIPKSDTIFQQEELAEIDLNSVPLHVAIIPDGNRRWAHQRSLKFSQGHQQGASNLFDIIKAAKELGVKALTFFTFSTENWSRSPSEVNALMYLIQLYLVEKREAMLENGVRLHTIGNLAPLNEEVRLKIEETKEITRNCSEIDMILAINYGARDEIRRAIVSMLNDYDQKHLSKEDITEELISRYLDTSPWSDPELLIRTSGEVRISNFLLWQISYTEVHLSDVNWPDFSPLHLKKAILDYQSRKRRLGGT